MTWLRVGALLGLAGVACGAFGAHGLENVVSDAQGIEWWVTGSEYHLWHALALVVFGLLRQHRPGGGAAGWAFVAGILLFSGTLYAMALGAPRWLGAITPVGGVALMVGWLLLASGGGPAVVRGRGP